MKIGEINPYVRYARKEELMFHDAESIAQDHRLFLVEHGSARFLLNGIDYTLTKGDVIFWVSGTRYKVEPEPGTVISGCNFDFVSHENNPPNPIPPTLFHLFHGEVIEKTSFSDTALFDDVLLINNAFSLIEKFHELYDEFEWKQILYEQRCSAILKDILIICMRLCSINHTSNSTNLTAEVLAYIKQNYSEKITNNTIFEKFHYHPNYISELIKRQTGLPLHKYISMYRIYTALNLLQSTEYSIREIAIMVGIADIHHFSKMFKKIIGSTPGSFRVQK